MRYDPETMETSPMLYGLAITLILLLVFAYNSVLNSRLAGLLAHIQDLLEPPNSDATPLDGGADLQGRLGGRSVAVSLFEPRRGSVELTISVGLFRAPDPLRLWPRGLVQRLYERLNGARPADAFSKRLQTWPVKQGHRLPSQALRDQLTREARAGVFRELTIKGRVLELRISQVRPDPEKAAAWIDRALVLAEELDPAPHANEAEESGWRSLGERRGRHVA